MLNGIIDLILGLAVKVGQLFVGEDAQCVELLFAVRADALDGLEVVGVLLGRLADALEIKRLLALLDAVHGALLLGLSLAFVSHDGDVPEEVHAGFAQLDASGVGATFVGWEFAVVELEVDDHLSIFANRQDSGAFHAEGRFVHVEATVVALIVVIDHLHADISHVGDGDFFNRRFGGSGLQGPNWSKDERVVLCSCTCHEVRLCERVLGFGAVGQHDQELVPTKQQQDGEDQQEEQQAREAPHPIDTVIVVIVATVEVQADRFPQRLTRLVVVGVRTALGFL